MKRLTQLLILALSLCILLPADAANSAAPAGTSQTAQKQHRAARHKKGHKKHHKKKKGHKHHGKHHRKSGSKAKSAK